MATRKPTAPTTTVKINNQHDYISLIVKLASGDGFRYTTSYSGNKLSASSVSEYLRSQAGMNALFSGLQKVSILATENEGQRFDRLKAICERATNIEELIAALQANATTPEQVAERRKQTYQKHCKYDSLPPDSFGKSIKIRIKGREASGTIAGYDERGSGKIIIHADGGDWLLDPRAVRDQLGIAHDQIVNA